MVEEDIVMTISGSLDTPKDVDGVSKRSFIQTQLEIDKIGWLSCNHGYSLHSLPMFSTWGPKI
jgi:hypothetical protein